MSVQKCRELRKELEEYGHSRTRFEIAEKVKEVKQEIKEIEQELEHEPWSDTLMPIFKDWAEGKSKTIARAYRDARLEVSRMEPIIEEMREKLNAEIEELRQEFLESELELKEDIKIMNGFANELKATFMVKVDDDVVFRMSRNDRIQIQKIEEE